MDPAAESRIEGGFAYLIESEDAFEIVAGATALFPSRLAQAQFATDLPLMLEAFLFGVGLVGANPDEMVVDELAELVVGDESGGVTSAVDLGGLMMRFDVGLFSRGRMAAVVFTVGDHAARSRTDAG
jgi:hypothetical protein